MKSMRISLQQFLSLVNILKLLEDIDHGFSMNYNVNRYL